MRTKHNKSDVIHDVEIQINNTMNKWIMMLIIVLNRNYIFYKGGTNYVEYESLAKILIVRGIEIYHSVVYITSHL